MKYWLIKQLAQSCCKSWHHFIHIVIALHYKTVLGGQKYTQWPKMPSVIHIQLRIIGNTLSTYVLIFECPQDMGGGTYTSDNPKLLFFMSWVWGAGARWVGEEMCLVAESGNFSFFLFFIFLHLIICGLTVPAQRGSLGWGTVVVGGGEKERESKNCVLSLRARFLGGFLSNSYDF